MRRGPETISPTAHYTGPVWRRFARDLGRFSSSLYLADIRIGGIDRGMTEKAFRRPWRSWAPPASRTPVCIPPSAFP
jgi:hypothetical protein